MNILAFYGTSRYYCDINIGYFVVPMAVFNRFFVQEGYPV